MENIVVLFKSNEGVFSGFLAKPFWDDPYQLPVAIGNYSYEKEDAQNFVNIIMNSDVGFRHGSTRLEKLANIESLDNILIQNLQYFDQRFEMIPICVYSPGSCLNLVSVLH